MKTQTYRTTRITTVATDTPLTAPAPRKAKRNAAPVKLVSTPAPTKPMVEIVGTGDTVLIDGLVPLALARAMLALAAGWQA